MRKVFAGILEYPVVKSCHYFQIEDNIPHSRVAFIDKPESHKNLIVNIPMHLKEIKFKCIAGIAIPKSTISGWEVLLSFNLIGTEVVIRDLTPK
jgi:hypothetical protein